MALSFISCFIFACFQDGIKNNRLDELPHSSHQGTARQNLMFSVSLPFFFLLTDTMHACPTIPLSTIIWRQQNSKQANYLARNVDIECKTDDDPMRDVQALRSHLYTANMQIFGAKRDQQQPGTDHLELFERMKMVDILHEFAISYRDCLKFASTPLPFLLIQMGRTFLFLWTFSIPLVLRGVVYDIFPAMGFVFFLTYGFVGLELVAMKLMNPFGDGIHDLNVTGMKDAAIIGMEHDLRAFGEEVKAQDKRFEYSQQKQRPPTKQQPEVYDDGYDVIGSPSVEVNANLNISHTDVYHTMGW